MTKIGLNPAAQFTIAQLGLKPEQRECIERCTAAYVAPDSWVEFPGYLALRICNACKAIFWSSDWDIASYALTEQLVEKANQQLAIEEKKLKSSSSDKQMVNLKFGKISNSLTKGLEKLCNEVIPRFLETCVVLQQEKPKLTTELKDRCSKLNYLPNVKKIITDTFAKFSRVRVYIKA